MFDELLYLLVTIPRDGCSVPVLIVEIIVKTIRKPHVVVVMVLWHGMEPGERSVATRRVVHSMERVAVMAVRIASVVSSVTVATAIISTCCEGIHGCNTICVC